MTIPRFTLSQGPFGGRIDGQGPYMSPNPMGEWVRYDDTMGTSASEDAAFITMEKEILASIAAIIRHHLTQIALMPGTSLLQPVKQGLTEIAAQIITLETLAK